MPTFGVGGSKAKTDSKSTTNTSSTTTPIVPEWASTLTQNAAGRVGDLLHLDPQSLVAPANPLQTHAAGWAGDLTGSPWNFDAAADLTRGVAQRGANTYQPTAPGPASLASSQSVLDNLDSYMSPYRRQVVDSALADFDFGAGQTRAQQDLDLAGSGAFGGSGAALTRSMTEDALTRGRAATSSNLYNQMFQQGATLSAGDADRRQQAALANAAAANQFSLAGASAFNDAAQYNAGAQERLQQRQLDAARGLADISSAYDANLRGNIATQAQTGQMLRDIDQQQRQAPVTTAQSIVAMLNGLPINLFVGQQQNGTSSTKGSETKTEINGHVGFGG